MIVTEFVNKIEQIIQVYQLICRKLMYNIMPDNLELTILTLIKYYIKIVKLIIYRFTWIYT